MDTPPTSRPDLTRWTGEKATAFLKELARTGKVAPAARSVGMSRQAAYRLRARAPKFAEFWDIAMRDAALNRRASGADRRRKPVHPLLARKVTAPPRQDDIPARTGSLSAHPQSHSLRGQ